MNKFKSWLENKKVQGAISLIAAVIMFYTPDHIDKIIEAMLTAFGIQRFTISLGKKD